GRCVLAPARDGSPGSCVASTTGPARPRPPPSGACLHQDPPPAVPDLASALDLTGPHAYRDAFGSAAETARRGANEPVGGAPCTFPAALNSQPSSAPGRSLR